MWRPLNRLIKRLFAALGGVLIVLAIGIGGFRLLITQLPSYQGEIRAWAREALGVNVEFTGLDARLGLMGPELTFHDASVSLPGDEANPILSATQARLGLNTFSLFTDRQLEASRLTLQGTRLTVERAVDGTFRLQHLPSDGPGTAFTLQDLPPVVIVVSDSQVAYEDVIRGTTWTFEDVRVELTRTMDNVRLQARANAPERLAGRVQVSAEASRLDDQGEALRAWSVFAEMRDVDLAMLSTFVPESTQLPHAGVGDLSVWLDVSGGRTRQATVQAAFADLQLGAADGGSDGYEQLELTAEWNRLQQGWTLAVRNLNLRRNALAWPAGAGLDLRVVEDEAGPAALALSAGFIRLEDLAPLTALFPEGAPKRRWVELAPRGTLSDVDLRWSRGPEGAWDYAVAGAFDRVGVSVTEAWPGLSGLSGEVRADSRSGRLALATSGARIDWPTLFPGPLTVSELDGILVWRQGRDGLRVVSDDLTLNNPDGRTRTTLELTYPLDGTSPVLELASSITDFNIAAAPRYLPAGIMPPGVFPYLQQAILGGRVSSAEVAFFGPVGAFPFDNGEGRFEAQVQIDNGAMAYVEHWPAAVDLSGTIDFVNAGWIAQGSGRVLGNESEYLRVGIADMRDPVLSIEARSNGPLRDVLGFLNEAPLIARHLGPDVARMRALGGMANVTFDLDFPLLDRAAYTLSAALQVVDGEVAVAGFGPTAGGIHGVLRFEDGALSAQAIEATLLEGPVTVAVGRPADPGYIADIAFEGEIDVEAVHRQFELPLQGRLAGQTRWRGNLLLPATTYTQVRREPLRIRVGSNLSGVALRLPEPFTKSPDQPTSFQLDFVFSESDRLEVNGHVGGARRFALSFRNRDGALSFRRGSVRFGGAVPLLPPRDGLTVNGSVGRVRLEEWWDLFADGWSQGSVSSLLLGANLQIADLSAFGQRLGPTDVALRQERTAWHLRVDSEPVSGSVVIPLDLLDRPQLVATMERLNVSTQDTAAATDNDPRKLPGVVIEADEFAVGQRRFGALSADIRADPQGLRLASFQTRSDSFSTEGSGGWFAESGGPMTRLALTLDSQDVATTLGQLGLDPITEAAAGNVALSVYWPGAPSADWTQSISGDLTLRLERGSVLNLEPGAGRMMGLMSINALPRRLALDFRDVFNRGLVFDEVTGDFLIIDGDAFTDNLYLTGPLADIGVVGRTGLHDQDYQQQAVVTAEPGNILPTVGFLAGPQVGAALLIFSQIFKEPLRGMGRAAYCVTGDWYEPSVERLTPTELHGDALCADLPPGAEVAQP